MFNTLSVARSAPLSAPPVHPAVPQETCASKSSGFTILELVVVMVIIATLSLVVAKYYRSIDADVPAKAQALASHIRYCQYRAMNSTVAFGLHFEGGQYYLYDDGNLANTHSLPGEDGVFVDLGADGYALEADGATTFDVVFDSWGIPYTSQTVEGAGAVPQDANRTLELSKGGTSRDVVVTLNTGYVP